MNPQPNHQLSQQPSRHSSRQLSRQTKRLPDWVLQGEEISNWIVHWIDFDGGESATQAKAQIKPKQRN